MIYPDKFLACMPKSEREKLGQRTSSEAQEKFLAGEEDKLQDEIRKYLNLHGIQFINPSMRRRSALPKGWPDFSFAYRGIPVALEAKTDVGRCTPEQREMHPLLRRDGWRVLVPRSLADVQTLFREIDAEKD